MCLPRHSRPTSGTPPKSNDGRLFRTACRQIRRHAKRQRDEEDAPLPAVGVGQYDTASHRYEHDEQWTGHDFTSHRHPPGQLHTSDTAPDTIGGDNGHSDAAQSTAAAEPVPGQRRHNTTAVPTLPQPGTSAHIVR